MDHSVVSVATKFHATHMMAHPPIQRVVQEKVSK
jgi:hypothetical protein